MWQEASHGQAADGIWWGGCSGDCRKSKRQRRNSILSGSGLLPLRRPAVKTANAKSKNGKTKVEFGSGNVFADLGLPNPQERLTKSMLASQIAELIEERGLTQTQAAIRLGIDQPKISNMLRGRLRGFSTERLMTFLNALDCDVIITIRPAAKNHRASVRVIA
jgi:predicted XRE-type DNA-binding protein